MKNSCALFLLLLASCHSKDTLYTSLSANETGIDFNNFIDEDAENNVLEYGYFYNGGGVAAADFNNDGLVDLYFTGNMVANKLYLNKGDFEFEDVSEKSGTALNQGWKTGVSVVDINDDGWIDIYVCRAGAQDPRLRSMLLYVNNGKTADGIPTFTEKSAEYGLDDKSYTTQSVFFDYDRDGDTDCFLLNHSVQKYAGFSNLLGSYREQRNDTYGNKLLRNDGGKYVNVTDSSGIVSNVLSFGLGINVSDFNDDGWQDIYISNDYNENDYLYLNQKDGRFKEVIREATGHVSLYSMGTDAADLNNDGLVDILTLDMLPASNERIKLTAGDDNYDKYQQLLRAGFHEQTMRNMLQLNNGVNADGVPVFSEIGQLAGVSNTDWSWAALMGDFDNDGWKDIFVSNGYARDYTNMEFLKYSTDVQLKTGQGGKAPTQMEIIAEMPPINEPDYIFQNQKGLTFTKKITEWGFEKANQSNGAIYADLDNDGDLDIVTNNVNQKAFVYKNNAETKLKANYLKVKLESPKYAFLAGTKLTLYSDSLTQTQHFMPVRGFQSAQWDQVHFGLGKDSKIDSLRITWADGSQQLLKNPAANKSLIVKYSDAKKQPEAPFVKPFTYWEPTAGVDFTHIEDARNDFRIQTLLPNMLSYQGPKIAQKDINGDGTDDLYIGGARGQGGSLFISKNGKFVQSPQPEFAGREGYEDAEAVFLDADRDGDEDLLVVSAGYELNREDRLAMPRLYTNVNGTFVRTYFPNLAGNAGTIAVSDIDRDGDLDVFLGVRVTPGRFPESAGGFLYTNNGKGYFTDQTELLAPQLVKAGMVTDAVFEDLNKDGYPELILTADWKPIQVFSNKAGRLTDASTMYGTAGTNGCWNAIKPADLDNDGDMDFVVGNMGTNWQWNLTSPDSLSLYAADYDNLQRIVPVISVTEGGVEAPYASRDELLDQIPSLKKKYTDYVSYSKAKLSDILPAEKLKNAQKLTAKIYKSGILENKNGKLVFRPLPIEAQFAPVYAISLFDMNADGKKDIILGGNLKQTRVRVGRSDASLIQVFLNHGNLDFQYVPQAKSGFYAKGEVRDLAVITAGKETQLLGAMNNAKLITYKLNKTTSTK
ncbi:VCBS repeat-containing protein [Dyadobacter sp. CY347]|uniref:VCBS repeat-containing protein n=1 Tax=Dyadobacter sp. CY347 TaxID=2909336 RepID=UPI001F2BAFF9|nr:VCBS repeat-containing protein [Dyadobacter sp. CY347]MCF2488407.1 VCBS repeat-containing protein [Dyadobacter sp. CY347]